MKKTLIALLALAGVSLAADSFSIQKESATQLTYKVLQDDGSYTAFETHAKDFINNASFSAKTLFGGTMQGGNTIANWNNFESKADSVTQNSFNIYYRGGVSGEWFMAANKISNEVVTSAADNGTLSTSITLSITTKHLTSKDYTIDFGIVQKTTAGVCSLLNSTTQTLTSSATTGKVASKPLSVNVGNFEPAQGATYYSVFRIIGYSADTSQTATNFNTASFTNWTAAAGIAVPEPATATLSLLALAGLAARRRRK